MKENLNRICNYLFGLGVLYKHEELLTLVKRYIQNLENNNLDSIRVLADEIVDLTIEHHYGYEVSSRANELYNYTMEYYESNY